MSFHNSLTSHLVRNNRCCVRNRVSNHCHSLSCAPKIRCANDRLRNEFRRHVNDFYFTMTYLHLIRIMPLRGYLDASLYHWIYHLNMVTLAFFMKLLISVRILATSIHKLLLGSPALKLTHANLVSNADYVTLWLQSNTIRTKSSFLFWLLDMSIICQHVHRLELRKSFTFCIAREIRTRFNFGLACPK